MGKELTVHAEQVNSKATIQFPEKYLDLYFLTFDCPEDKMIYYVFKLGNIPACCYLHGT